MFFGGYEVLQENGMGRGMLAEALKSIMGQPRVLLQERNAARHEVGKDEVGCRGVSAAAIIQPHYPNVYDLWYSASEAVCWPEEYKSPLHCLR